MIATTDGRPPELRRDNVVSKSMFFLDGDECEECGASCRFSVAVSGCVWRRIDWYWSMDDEVGTLPPEPREDEIGGCGLPPDRALMGIATEGVFPSVRVDL